MRSIVGKEIGVKAAGGVRSWDEMQELLSAGASRIGTSASVKILHEFRSPDITSNDERPGNDYY
jgi:deoxyribose-phosphate aldolase